MGGHSHWKGIKEKKGALDKKRGKIFAKLLRAIEVCARAGDSNPDNNPTLFDAIQRAKDASVPKDNIDRALARGAGEISGENWERVLYEGYGSGGVAVLCDALTNNRNRTSQDLKAVFRKHGGSLAEPGAVQWQFEKKGILLVEQTGVDEDTLMTVALEGGAEDVRADGDAWEVVTGPTDYIAVKSALEAAEIPIASGELTMLATTEVPVDGADARATLKLIDALEDLDDIQSVYANFDIPESVLSEVG